MSSREKTTGPELDDRLCRCENCGALNRIPPGRRPEQGRCGTCRTPRPPEVSAEPTDEQTGEYQANDAASLVGELFSGKVTVAEAIERLRTRLLDLSSRNPLLNYRHPKARCVQITEPNLNLIFDRLYVDGKSVPFKSVPEPAPDYEGKRPDAKVHAARLGISTSFEVPPDAAGADGRRLHGIQTLYYPPDLERQLRKIAAEARTAIEETGTNMLFLIFGFLEFYDSDDSERPLLAPLLSVPVALTRGDVDEETRTYTFTVGHNGEDLAENYTLRERLRRDFMLILPEFGDEDEPEAYFSGIEQAIKNKRRWKIRRQLTLGLLSFGKLAIWADLDTKKNLGLLEHELIKSVFSSGTNGAGEGGLNAEDYRIDQHPDAAQPLIFDADSSQHSAIIDVLAGKNLVINGPPGTGKSQTITNIIAAALSMGKKILFVSEKLAALEVVRHRLNQAGLGHFCLELHSNKTQKKKFIEDIQSRIEERFPAPPKYQAKIATLQRQKTDLARYAELMGSRVGNALGLTVHEIFWAAEHRRQKLKDLVSAVNALGFPIATSWTYDDIESRRSRLSEMAELYEAVGGFDAQHPWWGFHPIPLAPADDELIAQIISEAHGHACQADQAAEQAVAVFRLPEQPSAASAGQIRQALAQVPPVPDSADPALLPKMFPDTDPGGQRSLRLLSEVSTGVTKARSLLESAMRVLVDGERLEPAIVQETESLARERLSSALLRSNLVAAVETSEQLAQAVEGFTLSAGNASAPYAQIGKSELGAFLANCSKPVVCELGQFSIHALATKSAAVLETARKLSKALAKVETIATHRWLSFDSTPDAIARLVDPSGLPGLKEDVRVDEKALAEARQLVDLPLNERTLQEIDRLDKGLEALAGSFEEAIARCQQAVERLGIDFDFTERAVAEAAILAMVATSAPTNLLEYRRPTFGHARTTELVEKIRTFLAEERRTSGSLGEIFYLDALPPVAELKLAIAALRRKDGVFALFDRDWRKAKKLHAGLSKEKRKVLARQRAEELVSLAGWIEAKDAFISDSEMAECFGTLFRGLETDAQKIATLNSWYLRSRTMLVECPGLSDKVDLSGLPADRIAELATMAAEVQADAQKLADADAMVRGILGADVAGFKDARAKGWLDGVNCLRESAACLRRMFGFFAGYAGLQLSPKDAMRLMEARAELDSARDEIDLLLAGVRTIREAGGDELGHLAGLAVGSWKEALRTVSEAASLVAETAGQAKTFAREECLLAVAEGFAEAKAKLDEGWGRVAPLPMWSRFDGWEAFATAAKSDAEISRQVLARLFDCARPDAPASAEDVLTAFAQEGEVNEILKRFEASDDVGRLLGDLFDGAGTDLHRLSVTHKWGQAVCALDLPTAVQRSLLSIDARVVLESARRLYDAIDVGCRAVKETLGRLALYGSFSWDEWQKQSQGAAGRDLPSEIRSRLDAAARAASSVLPWSKYIALRNQCQKEDLGDFVLALESGKIPPAAMATAFELAAYQSIGRGIYQAYPELARFNGRTHEKIRADYQALDVEIISLTGKAFASQIALRTSVPEGQRGTTVGEYTDMHLLRREINKQRRHIPIRQLMSRAGRALQELKPCFMMGPLAVAQYLGQGTLEFDLIVMDEASQLRPEEALGAIARGSQLVVVGDPKQLPPTSFFDRMVDAGDEEEDEAPAAVAGMESILDICQQLFTPVRSLRWHYRSRHESLIAFSNHHFYKNLIVFPSPYAETPGLGVKYRYVRTGVYKDRQNFPEAQYLVDAVLEHMVKRPEESLGVVTLNQTQRELIEELLDNKLKSFSEGADFIGLWEAEGWPFFVKNLENVQGDERDVIFISTTFGKAPGTTRPRQNFGPISRPDGWRRLNVLFTRAKRRIELFTSMAAEDIIVDEKTPLGTKALRDYLDFAKRGILVSTDEGDRDPDSDFEVSVANVVKSMGYEVKPQLGVAGFFIDLAVRNPDRRGEFLAAIECDGATYHSGFSVRDRDRIRQEILESLGWKGKIHRIWSTDWFYNPRSEMERLRAFLRERRRLSQTETPIEPDEAFDETAEAEQTS